MERHKRDRDRTRQCIAIKRNPAAHCLDGMADSDEADQRQHQQARDPRFDQNFEIIVVNSVVITCADIAELLDSQVNRSIAAYACAPWEKLLDERPGSLPDFQTADLARKSTRLN